VIAEYKVHATAATQRLFLEPHDEIHDITGFGATIEEVDMIDIQAAVERADDPEIIALYESLLCGSRNHLRAFTSNLENAGHPYVAQFLDPTEVEAIISSPRETCGTP